MKVKIIIAHAAAYLMAALVLTLISWSVYEYFAVEKRLQAETPFNPPVHGEGL